MLSELETSSCKFDEENEKVMSGWYCGTVAKLKIQSIHVVLPLNTVVGLMVSRCFVEMIAHVTEYVHNVHTVAALFAELNVVSLQLSFILMWFNSDAVEDLTCLQY